MIRQIAFGFAFSAIVLVSGLASAPIAGHSTTKQLVSNLKKVPTSVSQQSISSPSFNTRQLEKSVFEKINRYRVSKGLGQLKLDARISRQARIHSQNMANGKVPFSHNGFERRVKVLPIRFSSAAENVAFNQGYDDPVAEAVRGWIHSPGHHVNIKGKYNLTGVGVAANRQGEVYLTQIFIYK